MCDRALTREYPTKGYGVCIDLTADKTTGMPAIAKFSLTGKDFMTNKIVGVEITACAAWEEILLKNKILWIAGKFY